MIRVGHVRDEGPVVTQRWVVVCIHPISGGGIQGSIGYPDAVVQIILFYNPSDVVATHSYPGYPAVLLHHKQLTLIVKGDPPRRSQPGSM